MVDHLISVHDAHRVEFVGSLINPVISEPFHVVQERLARLGKSVPSTPINEGCSGDHPFRVNKTMLLVCDVPDAIICGIDTTALTLFHFLRGLGAYVPDDVIVTDSDGIYWLADSPNHL